MLRGGEFDSPSGISGALPALAAVVRAGVDDKMQQVLLASVSLLEALLVEATR